MERSMACRILGIREDEEDQEYIRKQYRSLVKRHHPDVAGSGSGRLERVQQITEAYRVLKKDNILQPKKKKAVWPASENRAAFTQRNIYMEEEFFGNKMTIDTGIRGRYYWDPDLESFSLLMKSISLEMRHILEDYEMDRLSENSGIRVRAKLMHLLLQEFIDPYESIRLISTVVQADEAPPDLCCYFIPCHLKADEVRKSLNNRDKYPAYSDEGNPDPLNNHRKDPDPLNIHTGYSVFVNGNNLAVADKAYSGKVTFDENMFYYVVTPMIIQGAASVYFLPEKKTTGKIRKGSCIKGRLRLEVDETRKKDMTAKINQEIESMLARIR